MRRIIAYIFLMDLIVACSTIEEKRFPETVISELGQNTCLLENDALKAIWTITDQSIVLKEVCNKYDHEVVNLEKIILFSLELADGSCMSNHDFKLDGTIALNELTTTDSLPTKSLRFPGKEITGHFLGKKRNISIQWSAQLREGSNYVRQNIIIKSNKEPAEIKKVTFFDGELTGATYAGSVLGSPIDYKSFFFGLEHPIALSDALLVRDIGDITPVPIDVSGIIDRQGNYEIAVEHGGGPADFNITSIALEENGTEVSIDEHPLNGYGGSSIYRLQLTDYDSNNQYRIKADIIKPENASGRFHIYRRTDDILNFFVRREDVLTPGKSISEWSVIGVVPENQRRRAFLRYIERERARPYKQFLHYNCWWDITGDASASFTSGQLIERMHAWNQKFIEPYDITLHSFVFDDGWDDLDSVWYFDPVKFPEGFHPQAVLCREYNSGIGVWMSPYGGYGSNKKRRIASARREGLEINDKGLSLSGPNYYERFLSRALDMLDNYHANYFKFDGFGG